MPNPLVFLSRGGLHLKDSVCVWGGYQLQSVFSIDLPTMGPFHLGCDSGKLITKVNSIIFHLLTTQCVLFLKNIRTGLKNFPSESFLPRHPNEELWEGFRSKSPNMLYWDEYIYWISEQQWSELFCFRNSHLCLQNWKIQQIDFTFLFQVDIFNPKMLSFSLWLSSLSVSSDVPAVAFQQLYAVILTVMWVTRHGLICPGAGGDEKVQPESCSPCWPL